MRMLIILLLSASGCLAEEFYRVGVIERAYPNDNFSKYIPSIYEAGKLDVDIVLLPSVEGLAESTYDETVKNLAKAARQARVYIVAHLLEKTRCQNKNEDIRSNLVFDREGTVLAVYRKPINTVRNCTTTSSAMTTFKTDFSVTFGLLMEEDLVLQNSEYLKNLKHFIVAGIWNSEIPFLSGDQFSSSWAYTNNVNLITHTGIYSNRAVMGRGLEKILVADVRIDGEGQWNVPLNDASKLSFPGGDLSQYITRPLNIEASLHGYKESVCNNKFCCEFDIKTSFTGKPTEVSYGLAVFEGMKHYGGSHYIGIQSCRVYACAGLYKRSCSAIFENNTNLNFDKITITANVTSDKSSHYPIIISKRSINIDQFNFMQSGKLVTVTLKDVNILNFGILSRDFSNDVESINIDGITEGFTFYDYIFNDSVQEFFDYVWIRLRILIFVVSIYILEMM
ncbi:hypothetical protein K1T71_012737 [Dendrolimus kikuchii]|uniref:Uncharacterized protein n=1 Tax=Dendrolimus kikuchii TaxID=765133 RepID=A0ACC1CK63_9NEOP|nr:hypothetical protein K1T71_012737 [Dendrolimus kikuchii]